MNTLEQIVTQYERVGVVADDSSIVGSHVVITESPLGGMGTETLYLALRTDRSCTLHGVTWDWQNGRRPHRFGRRAAGRPAEDYMDELGVRRGIIIERVTEFANADDRFTGERVSYHDTSWRESIDRQMVYAEEQIIDRRQYPRVHSGHPKPSRGAVVIGATPSRTGVLGLSRDGREMRKPLLCLTIAVPVAAILMATQMDDVMPHAADIDAAIVSACEMVA